MKKKIIVTISIILLNLLYFWIGFMDVKDDGLVELNIKCRTSEKETIQVFYSEKEEFREENSVSKETKHNNAFEDLSFVIPSNSKHVRIDYGNFQSSIDIETITFKSLFYKKELDLSDFMIAEGSMIEKKNLNDDGVFIKTNGEDSYSILSLEKYNINEMYEKAEYVRTAIKLFLITFALDILIILLYRYKKIILTFIRDLYQNRRLAYDLAKNDFKTKYAGSYLGIIWAYIQPIVTVLLYWFVFQVGLRSGDVDGFPFVLWLLVGLVPWFFISESITSATNSLIEYSYLVKKVVFKINILPFVKIFSALFVHLFFLLFTIVIYWIAGYQPDLYYLQIIYYLVCTIILIAGISYMTSSFILFFRDLGQIINILLQVFMWMTPIMWNYQIISPKLSWIFKLNPMYYIITGYRDTFINKIWFWEHGDLTIVFWGVVSIILIIGTVVFEKLKVHFADVL